MLGILLGQVNQVGKRSRARRGHSLLLYLPTQYLALEYKCFFPYFPTGTGHGGFTYKGEALKPSRLMPHHYALCQLHMLVLQVTKTLFLVYGPITTTIFVIDLNVSWCTYMLNMVSSLYDTYVTQPNQVAANFCRAFENYPKFLKLTKEECVKAFNTKQTLPSLRCPGQQRRFRDK